MALNTAVENFVSRCQANNLADGTIAWYKQILKSLLAHLEAAGVHDARAITTQHLRDYLSARRGKGLSSETVLREWGALKCFFRFLTREESLLTDPMVRVERPKRERHLIEPMDMAQVRKLLDQADLSTTKGLENRAMMLLMVDSGLRLSEVLGLELRHIYWPEKMVTVLGKGRKERSVPVGRNTVMALEKYLAVRGAGGQLVFVSRGGKRHSPKSVQNRIRAYGESADIQGVRVSPHTLRHSFAIQWIRNGGDVFNLQKILGHSTLDMVKTYVNLASRDVSIQHKKFSPMDLLFDQDRTSPANEPCGLAELGNAAQEPPRPVPRRGAPEAGVESGPKPGPQG